nr:MFS transporter [Alloalcanivorax mobilis]
MDFFKRRPPFVLMVATGALCTVVLLVFGRLCYGLMLPAMRTGLDLSYSQAANLGTATALGYLLLVMVAGVFAARFGGKQAVMLGLAMVIVGFVGLSRAHELWVLMVLMVLLGMGTAFGYTPLISLLANTYPQRRGAVIGFTTSGVGAGMLLAGMLVPALTEQDIRDGWRHVWEIFAAGGLGVGVLALLFLRNPTRHYAASTAEALGEETAGHASGEEPVFRNPHVINVGLVYGVLGLTYIVQATFMYSYALDAGVPSLTAGHMASTMGMISIFTGPVWGWLSDRIGRANGLVLCMSLALFATALPVLWPSTPFFAAHFVILGMSVSGLFTCVLAASTETVPPHQAAVAVSFVTLFYAIGQLIGPAAAGVLIEWSGGFRTPFAASCAIMLVGVYLCWHTRRHQNYRPAARLPDACQAP